MRRGFLSNTALLLFIYIPEVLKSLLQEFLRYDCSDYVKYDYSCSTNILNLQCSNYIPEPFAELQSWAFLAFTGKVTYFVYASHTKPEIAGRYPRLNLQNSPAILTQDQESALDRQRSIARIAGAIAHELNSPLQGLVSLLTVLGHEFQAEEQSKLRIEQMRSGLTRLTRIIEAFSVAYERIPREPETVTVQHFLDHLGKALAERQCNARFSSEVPGDVAFRCLMPELVRLIGDSFILPVPDDRPLLVSVHETGGKVTVACRLRVDNQGETLIWKPINGHEISSSLAVLTDELTRFAGGRAEFLFDHASLCGVRLTFEVV